MLSKSLNYLLSLTAIADDQSSLHCVTVLTDGTDRQCGRPKELHVRHLGGHLLECKATVATDRQADGHLTITQMRCVNNNKYVFSLMPSVL